MEEKVNPLRNAKVEFRPAPKSLKIILILLILFSIAALIALRWVHSGIQDQIGAMKDEAAAIEHENAVLDEKKEDFGSVQSIQDIARDELGLVDPDTVIIDPQ